MEEFMKGDVVSIPFPFSDLSSSKKRPSLVLSCLEGDDVVLCQITSTRTDKYSIPLTEGNFSKGGLPVQSIVRPNKLFTADKSIIVAKHGTISQKKLSEIIVTVCKIIEQ